MGAQNDLTGMLPVRCIRNPEVALEWRWLGDLGLTDAFFSDSVARAFRRPYTALFHKHTPLWELPEILAGCEVLRPAGFIFHISRCGSTLISRSLAALPEVRVLSEPPAVDGVLRSEASPEQIRSAILAHCLAWSTVPQQKCAVIKFDCWDIRFARQIAKLFPETACLFVYREPLEVLVSHVRLPGQWTIPGMLAPELLGIDGPTVSMRPYEICARALGHFLRIGAELVSEGVLVPVDYRSLPRALFDSILPCFRINAEEAAKERVCAATMWHAKQISVPFLPDSDAKRAEAALSLQQLMDEFTGASWMQLQQSIHLCKNNGTK